MTVSTEYLAGSFNVNRLAVLSAKAARRLGQPLAPVVASGNMARSVGERTGRPYNPAHRGGQDLTCAKTMANGIVLLNASLLSDDSYEHLRNGPNLAATTRILGHEFLHAATLRRGEPSQRQRNVPHAPDRKFWLSNAWSIVDEYRVERALYNLGWPQDLPYVEAYEDACSNYLNRSHSAQSVIDAIQAVTARLGYAAPNPAINCAASTDMNDVWRELQTIPDATTPTSARILHDRVELVSERLREWVMRTKRVAIRPSGDHLYVEPV